MSRVLLLALVTTGCDPARVLTYDKVLCESDAECDDENLCTTTACDRLLGCVSTPLAEGSVCRAASGVCDYDDICDSEGTCVEGGQAPTGTPCGDPTTSECDGADTCTRQGVCSANLTLFGTPCGDSTEDACNARDTCNGAGSCLPNLMGVGTPCGNSVNNDCTAADTCDGLGACQDNDAATGAPCGGSVDCQLQDACDGDGTCIDNGQAPPGAPCGDDTDDECTNPDTCDAAGTCLANHAATGATCGDPTNNQCTNPDACDGSGACLANHAPPATACGSAATSECDERDSCDGLGNCLPRHVGAGTPCGNAATSGCDLPDTCDGDGGCAENTIPAGSPCGDSTDDICTAPDTCNTAGTCLPNHATDGTACGGTDSDCDHPDTCAAGICEANRELDGTACDDCPAGAGNCDACAAGVCQDDTCGDDTIDSGEICDGTDAGPCPGPCQLGCTCAPVSCLALLENGLATGVHSIDPDGAGGHPAFDAFCDMDTGGGGWTLLAWTEDSDGTAAVTNDGVPYPGLDPCPTLDCARGSATTAATTTALLAISSAFAKAQHGGTLTGHGTLSDYDTVGSYAYGNLSALATTYGATTCASLTTGSFTMVAGPAAWDGATVHLAQAFSASGDPDFSDDGAPYTWSVGTITQACLAPAADSQPSVWLGTASTSQSGPDNPSIGAHSVWVR